MVDVPSRSDDPRRPSTLLAGAEPIISGSLAMQVHCRNCGAVREIPKYHGAMLVTCPDCQWQEMVPPYRHLAESLGHEAGVAFKARQEHQEVVLELLGEAARMSPSRFAQFCAEMFTERGFDVSITEGAYDREHALELREGHETIFVTCAPGDHRYTVDDLERLAGAMRHDGVERAICVTTGTFDDACPAFAEERGIELMDGHALLERLADVPLEEIQAWVESGQTSS
jgi:hypothetical protein